MSAYAAFKLEFSPDPLSDTTPTWIDLTVQKLVRSATWFSGKQKDLDEPSAGGAVFLLKNTDRRFEPEYSAGAYYPNIVPLRRFRVTVTDQNGGTAYQQGVYYATMWTPTYPSRQTYSEVEVTCVDGFGLLTLLGLESMSPGDASSLPDVITADDPLAFYRLNDLGNKMAADAGPDGSYFSGGGSFLHGVAPITPGSNETATTFNSGGQGRAKIDDVSWFAGPNAFTCECVFASSSAATGSLLSGPDNGSGAAIFSMGVAVGSIDTSYVRLGGTAQSVLGSGTLLDGNPHHRALTWDGNTLKLYDDGVLVASQGIASFQMDSPASGQTMKIGAPSPSSLVATIQYAAFYEEALPAARIAAHASAALHGFTQQSAGDRIKALATNPLWSTAGITASAFQVVPRYRAGQKALDEIVATVQAEMPWGLFYFDDAGNPQYRSWDESTGTVSAVFGDAGGDIGYQDLELVYDDEIYNDVRTGRDGGNTIVQTDATSQAQYLQRTIEETGLLTANDGDVSALGAEILATFKDPRFRVATLTLNGADPRARAQILSREIGDLIRVRRLSAAAVPIDVITTILGKTKSMDVHGQLVCQWTLARGFNALDGLWHVGVAGYSELGQTTVLA